MNKKETMWAICGRYGLYTGTYYTRRAAISDHVRKRFVLQKTEADAEKAAWKRCRQRGDYAVKVEVCYEEKRLVKP